MKQVISTTKAPAAIGPYSQAIKTEQFIYCSGQLGIDPETGKFVGEGVEEQTEQVFKNIANLLAEAGSSLDKIVKTTVFLSDMNNFQAMNKVYASKFTADFPARSAFQVAALPMNGLVEIEVIAAVD